MKKQDFLDNEQNLDSKFSSNTESQNNDIDFVNIKNVSLCVGNTQLVLNSNDNDLIIELFGSHYNDIIEDIYKLSYDFSFMIDKEKWDYCSEAGAFCNTLKNQSFLISESEKNRVN